MDRELAQLVERKLDEDHAIDVAPGLLVLAALDSDESLKSMLAGEASRETEDNEPAAAPPPVGAYLTSIAVEGFRGIGPRAELPIEPGPGLTLVIGPNGCGKSSFAEGLEILLTGSNRRWDDRSAVWKDGWRNLHHGSSVRIEAGLAVEGARGETRIERHWDPGDQLPDSVATAQTIGQPRDDLSMLGWDEALDSFRPFLSYNELGTTLEAGPTTLYDNVSRVLGLDALVDARALLRQARLVRQQALREADTARSELVDAVETLDDLRAGERLEALQSDGWGLDRVEQTLEGATGSDAADELATLRQLAAIDAPDEGAVEAMCRRLRDAQGASDATRNTDAARALQLADLLELAVGFHEHTDSTVCPVCGSGALDDAWRQRAEQEVESLRREGTEAQKARDRVDAMMREGRAFMQPLPNVVDDAHRVGIDVARLRAAWDVWLTFAADAGAGVLADHMESALGPVREIAALVREQAEAELERREDAWRPVAQGLRAWLPVAREAQRGSKQIADLSTAEEWLQRATDELRTERFAPLAARSSAIWAQLRQGSSVDITRFDLAGSGNRRRLAVDVTVEGTEGAALGVMSQGELHSLALSLFLPRATLAASPFRFVVIDDPVQAMDPSKVDGLARVLDEVARERQVVVLTHDDRLPEAVRRLGIDAIQLQVARRGASEVEVRQVSDPVERYLDDARALIQTEDLPDEVASRVVPVFCRNAIEAVCMEVVRRRWIGRGVPHREVEESLEQAQSLVEKAGLLIFDGPGRAHEVGKTINTRFGRRAGDTFFECNRGSHDGTGVGALRGLIDGSEALVGTLRLLN